MQEYTKTHKEALLKEGRNGPLWEDRKAYQADRLAQLKQRLAEGCMATTTEEFLRGEIEALEKEVRG